MITIPQLDAVSNILDTDVVIVAHANGIEAFRLTGANLKATMVAAAEAAADSTPTRGSNKLVKSGGVHDAIKKKIGAFYITAPNGSTRYYRIKNTEYSKVSNIYIGNRYAYGYLLCSGASASTKMYRIQSDNGSYGLKGVKTGKGEDNLGYCYIKIDAYNPFYIVPLCDNSDNIIEVTLVNETEWNSADSTTLENFVEWTDVRQMATLSLPNPPTTDDTYVLQCDVSSGLPTYRWVSTTSNRSPETRGSGDDSETGDQR